MSATYRKCPFCGNDIRNDEALCSYCKASVLDVGSYADLHRDVNPSRGREHHSPKPNSHCEDAPIRRRETDSAEAGREHPAINTIKRMLDYLLNY